MANLPPGVIVLPRPADVARRGALELVRVAQRSVAERGTFIVALSGGSTPKAMYELLANNEEFSQSMPWWQTHWFWGDERHVPPDSEDSNFRMANEALLSKSPTPQQNIHRVRAELADPAATAAAYENEMLQTFRQLGRPDEDALAFDLLLLGMGGDGHTASLFPHTAALRETTRMFVANEVEKLETVRFTITPKVIEAASHVLLLVAGADKAEMVRQVLRGQLAQHEHPVQMVNRRTRPTVWLLDQAAAEQLA
jgi:6-phosphogluconolactonase